MPMTHDPTILDAIYLMRSWLEKVGGDMGWHMILFFVKFYHLKAHITFTIWNDIPYEMTP